MVIAEKLLFAARTAYLVAGDGPLPVAAGDPTGWLSAPTGFVSGEDFIDAAYIGETATEIIVAYRGTLPVNSPDHGQVILDWLNSCDAILVSRPGMTGQVHQGFYDAVAVLWGSMEAVITAASAAAPAKPVYVTGHSKGGAAANLAACLIRAALPAAVPVIVTTFAAARPGDPAFQAWYDTVIPHSIRFEAVDDIVPHLPPADAFFNMFSRIPYLSATLQKLSRGYASVGDLYFINWQEVIVPDSPLLEFDRFAHMAGLMVTLGFGTIVGDHSIDPGSAYARAPFT